MPVRFKGFSEPPEIWPEAEQWWSGKETATETKTWESLSAVQPVASLTAEFNQFPPTVGGDEFEGGTTGSD